MKQTKKGSLIETMTNIMIGYWINFGMNLVILPLFGFNVTIKDNFMIGALFTVVSVCRSYGVRRIYNHFGWFQEKVIIDFPIKTAGNHIQVAGRTKRNAPITRKTCCNDKSA